MLNIFGKNRKLNILVVGSNGMLGREVYSQLTNSSKKRFTKIGHVWKIDRNDYDFATRSDNLRYFNQKDIIFPDVIVNCAAFTDTAAIQKSLDGYIKAYSSNVVLPKLLAESCAKRGIKLVHISTDYVLSEYCRDDTVRNNIECEFPLNIYGLQKLLAEQYVENEYLSRNSNNYLTIRTSWLFGPNDRQKTFPEKIAKKIVEVAAKAVRTPPNTDPTVEDNGFPVAVDARTQGYPTSTWFLSQFIERAIESGITGTIDGFQPFSIDQNTGAATLKSVSRVDFANEVMHYFKISGKVPPKVKDFAKIEPTVFDVDRSKFEMHHPTKMPKLIATGSSLEKYRDLLRGLPTWQEHVFKFLETEAVSKHINEQITALPDNVQKKFQNNPESK